MALKTARDRGLPSIPRGLSRDMTCYLQSIHNIILGMSGLGRNTADSRAMRVDERQFAAGGSHAQTSLGTGSILTAHIATGAVTESKIAAGAVTADKIAPANLETRHIKPQAIDTACLRDNAVTTGKLENASVNSEKLAAGCVTRSKLAHELIPAMIYGLARHGDIVNLKAWAMRPLLCVTGFGIDGMPERAGQWLQIRIANLHEADGKWQFEAVAHVDRSAENIPDRLGWLEHTAFGWRNADDKA